MKSDKQFPAVAGLTIELMRSYIALVKWRNQLLALLCLAVFAGLGVLYFQHWVVQKPFGIILIIGEGLAPERIALTRVYLGGSDARLALDGMPHVALVTNYSRDFAVSDQAAAASALATGVKVNNRSLSIDPAGKPRANIIELARNRGRATGLVTNESLTNATCAAFYAHAPNANDSDQIARQLVEGGKIDICMGMSTAEFLPEAKQGQRQDNRDLLLELRQSGFDVVRTRAELESIPVWRRPKLFGAFADGNSGSNQAAWNDEPALSDMVRRAIELLQFNQRGYLLIVDAGRMRKAAETNNAEKTLTETAELDRTLSTAQRYAGPKSTIIVSGDTAIVTRIEAVRRTVDDLGNRSKGGSILRRCKRPGKTNTRQSGRSYPKRSNRAGCILHQIGFGNGGGCSLIRKRPWHGDVTRHNRQHADF